jgi:putative flippase GtrA
MLFNGVGAIGVVVQLGALAFLVGGLQLHYLTATVIAVEAAILHNFMWHHNWTWRDRPSRTFAGAAARLVRFHLLNGVVSLVGNVAVMAALTGGLGMHPVAANAMAIGACSTVNFLASEVFVFRTAIVALLVVALTPESTGRLAAAGSMADLQPQTALAWRLYEEQVDARYRKLQPSGERFFAHDEFERPALWKETARRGGIAMMELNAPTPAAKEPSVPDGRIHHWVGAVFVRGVTVEAVVNRLLARAGHEAGPYQDVLASRLIDRQGDRVRVFMKLRRDSIITVTYNTEHAVEYRRLGPIRAASRSVATKIAELSDPGTAQEREKPPNEDHGFLWRLNAYWRYEQADDGVLIECESVSLSRSVPLLIRPFVNGMVEGIARESLERTLMSLRTVLAAI